MIPNRALLAGSNSVGIRDDIAPLSKWHIFVRPLGHSFAGSVLRCAHYPVAGLSLAKSEIHSMWQKCFLLGLCRSLFVIERDHSISLAGVAVSLS